MSEQSDETSSVLNMVLNPSKSLANWFIAIGLLGLFMLKYIIINL